MRKREWMLPLLAGACMVSAGTALSQEAALNRDNSQQVERAGGKTRKITLLEDRNQTYMVTKIYEIKNMKASDLRPFVEGAVRRADPESTVARLNYKKGKRQFLSVSMPDFMVPHIDDMIKKLDRPGIKDKKGCVIAGTGIHHFYYHPNYRSTQAMWQLINNRFTGGDEAFYRDADSNVFYWKGSGSDGGKSIPKWLKAIDRPVPQMSVRVKIYEVSEDNLIELGLDWVAFKNGPAAEIFGAGLNYLDFQHLTDLSSMSNMLDLSNVTSFTSPGVFVAPNIDLTFIRLLNQKGEARVATSAYLSIVNDQDAATDAFGNSADPGAFATARYRISFNPVFQAITKTNDQFQETAVESRQPSVSLYLVNPVISHNDVKNPTESAFLNLEWHLTIDNAMTSASNTGDRVEDDYAFESTTTIAANNEKLLATYEKRNKVNQNNGVPFLSEIPVLKYIFGSTADTWKRFRYYVTLEAAPIKPETSWGEWAGRIVTADDLLKNRSQSDATATLPTKNKPVEAPYLYKE